MNTPKGTKDFYSLELVKRNYLLKVLKQTFNSFNFEEIQTPSFENLSVLTGNYGEDEDSLMFKILSSGEKLRKADLDSLKDNNLSKFANSLSDKALRYDLTVPLSRFIRQNLNKINLPFRRFQTQLVWRADRPQKGRFREFLQCDIDVIGENNIMNEVECIKLFDSVLTKLNFPKVFIRVNNREILDGISKIMKLDSLDEIGPSLDKSDKIGIDGVINELKLKGVSDDSLKILKSFLEINGSNHDKIALIKKEFLKNKLSIESIERIEIFLDLIDKFDLNSLDPKFDISLARGLGYYTGLIVEVSSPENINIGSIGGGGRYDNLVQGNDPNLSGFGISFGFDRLYTILEDLNLFPNKFKSSKTFLFLNFGMDIIPNIIEPVNKLRENNIACEIYPSEKKIKKQLDYANQKGIDFVVIIGKEELDSNKFKIKDMTKGEEIVFEDLNNIFKEINSLN
ncbi:MAG: histidine--tRNA ligase [Bacteroidota bacterium]